MTMLLNAGATGSSQQDEGGLIDCSLHHSIKDKPAQFRQEFSRNWQQQSLSLLKLRQHVSTGGAFIPAAMTSSKRSSQAFLHADLAVVDIDGGLSIDDFLRHELAFHAAWIYTTCSHKPNSGQDRFRIVFRLQERITDPEEYKRLLSALSSKLGGDRSCTDPCRLFYGNSNALHPLFSPGKILSSELVRELSSKPHRATEQKNIISIDYNDDIIAQAEYVLEHALEPTADGERDRFIKVTAAACSAGDALLDAWQSWAARCHHTSGHRRKQGTERFFHSFLNTRSSVTTLFFLASEQNPDWRDELPDELRSSGYCMAPNHSAAGYAYEDFLHGGTDNPAFGDENACETQDDMTMGIFDVRRDWILGKHQPSDESVPEALSPTTENDDEETEHPSYLDQEPLAEPDPDDDYEDDHDCGFEYCEDGPIPQEEHRTSSQNGRSHYSPRRGGTTGSEAQAIYQLVRQHFPELRLNLLTQRFEYVQNNTTIEIKDTTSIYIQISVHMEKIPPKTGVTDLVHHMGRCNNYHPVLDYLDHCADTVDPWPQFGSLATEILGLSDDETQNPTLANGQPLADAVLQRFLIAAVARIFEPGCTVQWMPILVGDQAIGKSRFLELLTPESPQGSGRHTWTAFNQVPLKSLAERPHQLHCGWIVVLDETERHFKRDQVEIFKNLISISTDRSAPKYQNELDYPRAFVLVGATNTDTFLKDPTGNRRFLPIYVNGKPKPDSSSGERSVDLQRLVENRDAIWSAAVHAYRQAKQAGEQPWHFLSHELAEIKTYMDGFFSDNPYMSRLAEMTRFNIDQKHIETFDGMRYVKLHHIFEFLGIAIDRHSSATIPVSDALRRLGYTNKRIRSGGKQIRAWFFPEDQQPKPEPPAHPASMPTDW